MQVSTKWREEQEKVDAASGTSHQAVHINESPPTGRSSSMDLEPSLVEPLPFNYIGKHDFAGVVKEGVFRKQPGTPIEDTTNRQWPSLGDLVASDKDGHRSLHAYAVPPPGEAPTSYEQR